MVVAALLLAIAVLVPVNLLLNRYAPRWYPVVVLGGCAALALLYRWTGLPWSAAGLAPGAARRALPWALLLVGLVAAGCLAGALVPATRPLLTDTRAAGLRPGQVAYQVLARIPLGTVLLEELAFRGVLYGLLWHLSGPAGATLASAALFGLWHVLPAAATAEHNRAVGRAFAGRAALLVAATVLGTGLAGVLLGELCRRTGSLLTPFALHWAVNGLGYLTAFLLGRHR